MEQDCNIIYYKSGFIENDRRRAIIKSKDPTDIQELISCFSSKDRKERENARAALVSIGEPAIAPLLNELGKPDKWARWEAAKALAEMRAVSVAPILVKYLTNEHPDIRWLAAEGLIALGTNSLVPLLTALTHFSGALRLGEGAHHVLHDLSLGKVHDGEDEYEPINPLSIEVRSIIKPVLKSLDNVESAALTAEHAKIALHELELLGITGSKSTTQAAQ